MKIRPLQRIFLILALILGAAHPGNAKIYPDSSRSPMNMTPGGMLDHVFDRFGNQYRLQDIAINGSHTVPVSNVVGRLTVPLCNSGYFALYLDSACGMDNYANDTTEMNRLNVVCQVLRDMSDFINSPCALSGQKVNIWVRSNHAVAMPSDAGASATPFYFVPNTANGSGIVDNTTWVTLMSGKDAYTNVVSPLANGGTTFFHSQLVINFDSLNWNLDMTSYPSATQYDLYSTILHEVQHALGIASLIGQTGASTLVGISGQYYDRFDQFLNYSGSPLITQPAGTCSPMYNYSFPSGLVSALHPDPTNCIADYTNCATAIKFSGTDVLNIYTPNCWEAGSSLSHFEDACPPINSNNTYYVMANAAFPGTLRRALEPDERQVLCDLGYSVNATFGHGAYLNGVSYPGGNCPGSQVAGICDGITSTGTYAYITPAGTAVTLSGLLTNDYNADSISCLQVVTGGTGTFNTTSGNTSTTITYTPDAGSTQGVHLLRYVPVNRSNGKCGNITYVYVRVSSAACAGSPCSMVVNGSFESSTGCGSLPGTAVQGLNMNLTSIDCWDAIVGAPDLYNKTCLYPYQNGFFDCSIPTGETTPPTDIHQNSIGSNTHFLGMGGGYYQGMMDNEAVQTTLTTSLQNGTTYNVTFWAKVMGTYPVSFGYSYLNMPMNIQFSASQSSLAPVNSIFGADFSTMSGIAVLTDTAIAADGQWHPYSLNFTYTGPTGYSNLIMAAAPYLNTTGYPAVYEINNFLDDITLNAVGGATFTFPDTVSTCDTFANLISNVSGTTSGTFSGNGISQSGTIYSFNPVHALAATGNGLQVIVFSYNDVNGCSQVINKQVFVKNNNPNVHITATPDTSCSGQQVTLKATGGTHYTWTPATGVSCDTCAITLAHPTANTIYGVYTTTASCISVATDSVIVPDTAVIDNFGITSACQGENVTLAALDFWPYNVGSLYLNGPANATYQWYLNGVPISWATASNMIVSVTGSYKVDITLNGQCTLHSQPISIFIDTPVVHILPTGQLFMCQGDSLTLTTAQTYPQANWSADYSLNGQYVSVGSGASNIAHQSGSYVVTVRDSLGCTGSANDTIHNYFTPAINATGIGFCPGGSITLNANTGTGLSYVWNMNGSPITPAATGGSLVVSTVGNYTVTETDSHGCTATSPVTTESVAAVPVAVINTPANDSLCPGSSMNLSANTGTGYTYKWLFNSGSGWTLLPSTTNPVSINQTGSYKVVVTNSSVCSDTSAAIVIVPASTPVPTITYTGPSTLCVGNTLTMNASPGTGYTYQWQLNNANITGATANSYTASTSGNYTVTISSASCTVTSATLPVQFNTPPSASITTPAPVTLCTGSVSLSANTGTGYTYTWLNNGTPITGANAATYAATTGGSYTVQVGITGCTSVATSSPLVVTAANTAGTSCAPCTVFGTNNFAVISAATVSSLPATNSAGDYYISSSSLTFTHNLSISNANIMITANATINIAAGVSVTFNNCHLFGCTSDMWNGIILQTNGTSNGNVTFTNSLVEDALATVTVTNATSQTANIITSNGSIFNRNASAINIFNYQAATATYPFSFSNSVFTSRANVASAYNAWPAASALRQVVSSVTSVYDVPFSISNFYPAAQCKNGMDATAGILLSQVGHSIVPVSGTPTYDEIVIGVGDNNTSANTTQNLFDNLHYGVYATGGCNVTLVNNAFANIQGTGANGDGDGVFELATTTSNSRLRLYKPTGTIYNNAFYNCIGAVSANQLYDFTSLGTSIISNHTVPVSTTATGQTGLWLTTNHFANVDIENNSIANVNTGISIGTSAIGSTNINPTINIHANTVAPEPYLTAYTPDRYMTTGISLQNGLSCTGCNPNTNVFVGYNTVADVFNGISVNGFNDQLVNIDTNQIYLRKLSGPTGQQFGVYAVNNRNAYLYGNNVTESDALTTDSVAGMYLGYANGVGLTCNSVVATSKGYEFVGPQDGIQWLANDMSQDNKGLVIEGSMGDQGDATHPVQAQWVGGWPTGVTSQVYTIGSTLPTNSKLYIAGTSGVEYPANNTNSASDIIYTYSAGNGIYSATFGGHPSIGCPFIPRPAGGWGGVLNIGPLSLPVAHNGVNFGNAQSLSAWIAQFSLYKDLLTDSTIVVRESTGTLQDFLNKAVYSRYAYIVNIENYLVAGDYRDAQTLLATEPEALTPTDPDPVTGVQIADYDDADGLVDNYRSFYNMYIEYATGAHMSSTDSGTLTTLAALCPVTNGPLVFQARALYTMVFNQLKHWNDDNCYTGDEKGRSATGIVSPKSATAQRYQLYPNPTDGNISILQSISDGNPVAAEVWNAEGKMIHKAVLHFADGVVGMNMKGIVPGLYMLQLRDSAGNNYALKFVVN